MVNKVRAAQAVYGKFLANVHQSGKGDGAVNLAQAAIAGVNLVCVGYSVFSLMGNGTKIEGR
eukprot:CAMPEP_0172151698 /NCGR_PEP_ID=MMETSP1050-20130122/381_1 /TAXON_ID=233186 /ORGANISM="Cryptomonas curvata, Strain CCAP979/52" /LENGTH=61 /DNA_ID=CAMNT_0012819847 /DNA_START=41 /DNA_END=226 /DNA_ORIENTATION=+